MRTKLLTIENITPLHVGGITPDAVIDNTIQRNAITREPNIFSSSLKGAIRSHFRRYYSIDSVINILENNNIKIKLNSDSEITIKRCLENFLFGEEGNNNNQKFNNKEEKSKKNIGQMSYLGFTDSYLLEYCIFNNNSFDTITTDKIVVQLEERLKAFNLLKVDNPNNFFNTFKNNKIKGEEIKTEIRTHIAIDYETGIALNGHLWIEEYVNPKTKFYFFLILNDYLELTTNEKKLGLDKDNKQKFREILLKDFIDFLSKNLIQIGAGESLGQGFCRLMEINNENI